VAYKQGEENHMFKRMLSIGCALCIALSVAACGRSKAPSNAATQANRPAPQTQTSAPETAFEETVVIDNTDCTFIIKAIDAENFMGYTLQAYLENKTDKELLFTMENASVNGFMCDPFWATTVTAGMKANAEISFSSSDFENNGIREVTEIAFTLKAYDSNDLTEADVINEHFILYPMGEEAVQPFTRTPVEGETVLFDNESCTMIVTGYDPDSEWGYSMNAYLENKTDKTLMFSIQDAAVNGFMCDPFWAESVAPGKRSNTVISWLSSDFEENGIVQVESIVLPIRVYDNEDYLAENLIDESFTLNP
jgi:hypothetical protein